ncbi:MAG: FAD-dependent thymidylate synthase [Thiotrichaceae bacterium]|nr:FAD-dependent thymidylate synthase [Thiotrichaceae bacterium]
MIKNDLPLNIPLLDKGFVELQDFMGDDLAIVNAARVSFLGESKGDMKDKKLLNYLLRNAHTSPFEMVEFKLRVKCPLFVARQWMRHRTWCLTGDTEITFNRPDRWAKGIHTKQTGNKGQSFTLERLYHLWNTPNYHAQIKNMLLRVYDEKNAVFTVSHIKDVLHSGVKEVFEVTLEDGKKLKCSKDHQLLTTNGWQRLEEAVGLEITNSGKATMSKDCYLTTNGTTNLWRSHDWMSARRNEGLSVQQIADQAGCSYPNIRKWLKIHDLKFDPLQNLNGVNGNPVNRIFTEEQKKFDYTCQVCGEKKSNLHAHHVKSVAEYPELARDFDNLVTVCKDCHIDIHRNNEMARSDKGTPLASQYKKVVSIKLLGKQETYDIEVEGEHHNFVANGIVVHNSVNEVSRRYTSEELDFYIPETWRLQSTDNKQCSGGDAEQENQAQFTQQMQQHVDNALATYHQMVDAGIAREQARMVLPQNMYTTFVGKVDAHNLMHFMRLRMDEHAQYEIRVYAEAIYAHFFKAVLPWSAEAFEKHVLKKA